MDIPEASFYARKVTLTYLKPCSQGPQSTKPLLTTYQPDGKPWMLFYRATKGYLVRIAKHADFHISESGHAISASPAPGISTSIVENLCLNQAVPLALSLQKKLVLHGSSVDIDNSAVAFIAESGRGKSTLASSFTISGQRFLTDDGLFLEKLNGYHMVLPGHPSIRLWDDSRKYLEASMPIEFGNSCNNSKTRIRASRKLSYCNSPLPLRWVYFLGDGSSSQICITSMPSNSAMIELLRHCFMLGVDERELLKSNFELISDLAGSLRFFKLDYPRQFGVLEQVKETIINHVRAG